MSASSKPYDLVVFGATSFTGKLAAEYLLNQYGASPESFKWAMAGRSAEKLAQTKEYLASECNNEAAKEVPCITADSHSVADMERLVSQTRVVVTTVGPYNRYGSELVAACAKTGTHYCDLTGEGLWVRDMINKHHAEAEASGAMILPSTGFDSLPPDLTTFMLTEHFQRVYNRLPEEMDYYITGMLTSPSGGTMNTVTDMMGKRWTEGKKLQARMDDNQLLAHPPAVGGAPVPPGPALYAPTGVGLCPDMKGWKSVFPLAVHDAHIVQRSLALRGLEPIKFQEFYAHKGRFMGLVETIVRTFSLAIIFPCLLFPPTRALFQRFLLPASGQGPSKKIRETGYFWAEGVAKAGQQVVRCRAGTDVGDPGYKATSMMMVECGLTLALDGDKLPRKTGGIVTAGAQLGMAVVERLRNVGFTFTILDPRDPTPAPGPGRG